MVLITWPAFQKCHVASHIGLHGGNYSAKTYLCHAPLYFVGMETAKTTRAAVVARHMTRHMTTYMYKVTEL